MKENFKTLVFTFSVILNLAFIGTTAFQKLSSYAATGRTPQRNGPFLYQELNLSREQLARIEPVRDRFHGQLDQIGGQIKARQLEIIDLLAEPELDRKTVNALQERTQGLQQTMQATIINHIVEETAIFTPEQRKAFFRLIKERLEQSSQSCPPWMRPSQDGR